MHRNLSWTIWTTPVVQGALPTYMTVDEDVETGDSGIESDVK
jgi:hypothetical protein